MTFSPDLEGPEKLATAHSMPWSHSTAEASPGVPGGTGNDTAGYSLPMSGCAPAE